MLGFRYGSGILRFVDSELGLHAGFFVEDLANRGRLIAAMFLIGQRLESPVEDKRKRDRNSDGFLVSHGADRVTRRIARQENSGLTWCMIQ